MPFFLIYFHNRKLSGKRWFLRGAWKDMGHVQAKCKLCKKYLTSSWGRKLEVQNVPFWRYEQMKPYPKVSQIPVCSRIKTDWNVSDVKLRKHLNGRRVIAVNTAGDLQTWYGICFIDWMIYDKPSAKLSKVVEYTGQCQCSLLGYSKACCLWTSS